MKQQTFLDNGSNLEKSIETSTESLQVHGSHYKHWVIGYSGGKDSSATVTFVSWAIQNKLVDPPDSLTVLYADTRMELPPLQKTAMVLMGTLQEQGIRTHVVYPEMDNRFFVYMFGRGVPPPSNTFRWCTPKLKIEPMAKYLETLREDKGKFLMITGVRMGESAARDGRITAACNKDSGECGQGWLQVHPPSAVADTLAPLLHWRLCHVYDWLYFEQDRHGYDVSDIATVYGDGEVRTGCVGCSLASRDFALERIVKSPKFKHMTPLLELKPLYRELKKPDMRLRKPAPERRKDGRFSKNGQRMGPLTMEARKYGLSRIMDIQDRAGVDLINDEELERIHELIDNNTWPNKWEGTEPTANKSLAAMKTFNNGLNVAVQPLLWG